MPYHNAFIHDPAGNPSAPGLRVLGAFFPIEVHIPPQIAQALAKDNKPIPAPVSGLGLIDTGATMTCVHEDILTSLGLNPIGVVQSGTAAGPVQQNVYPVRITFPSKGWTLDVQAAGVNLSGQMIPLNPPQPAVVLLGRNVLEKWVFIWNGPSGHWTVAF
jgi:hypothetical protein